MEDFRELSGSQAFMNTPLRASGQVPPEVVESKQTQMSECFYPTDIPFRPLLNPETCKSRTW